MHPIAGSPRNCRICYSSTGGFSLISPCLCNGSQRFVHLECLDEWRNQDICSTTFTHCPTCRFEYITEDTSSTQNFVGCFAGDSFWILGSSQLLMHSLAEILRMIDKYVSVVDFTNFLVPPEWINFGVQETHISPFYFAAIILSVYCIGLVGFVSLCNDICDSKTQIFMLVIIAGYTLPTVLAGIYDLLVYFFGILVSLGCFHVSMCFTGSLLMRYRRFMPIHQVCHRPQPATTVDP